MMLCGCCCRPPRASRPSSTKRHFQEFLDRCEQAPDYHRCSHCRGVALRASISCSASRGGVGNERSCRCQSGADAESEIISICRPSGNVMRKWLARPSGKHSATSAICMNWCSGSVRNGKRTGPRRCCGNRNCRWRNRWRRSMRGGCRRKRPGRCARCSMADFWSEPKTRSCSAIQGAARRIFYRP